jgi:hypothetical protein
MQPMIEVVELEKALRRERHGHQELRGVKEVITALFGHKKVRVAKGHGRQTLLPLK